MAGCNNSLPTSAEILSRELVVKHADDLSQVSDPFAPATIPGAAGYKIGPHDVIEVNVFKAPELSRVVEVSHDGNIYLPLIGAVQAGGKTATMVEHDISARYNSGYLKSPHINVFVKEYNSNRITVDGGVHSPGVYTTHGNDTLMAAISQAKGVDHETASTGVVVYRQEADGQRSATHYDLSAIKNGKSQDPPLQNGDVVVVEESTAKETLKHVKTIMPLATMPLMFLRGL